MRSRSSRKIFTDDAADVLYELYGSAVRPDDGAPQWGDGFVRREFHRATAYPYAVDQPLDALLSYNPLFLWDKLP